MVKKFFIFVAIILSSKLLWAQNAMTDQQINDIKLRPDMYIYAESTCSNWNEALNNAKYLLTEEIISWAKGMGDTTENCLAKTQSHIVEFKNMRGHLYRAFVYVKTEDIAPYITIASTNTTDKDSAQFRSDNLLESNHSMGDIKKITLSPIERDMLEIKDAENIEAFIRWLKDSDRLDSYGSYKNIHEQDSCYVFVHNKEREIAAHLKRAYGDYLNLNTGKVDDISNYKGCGAIWFKIK